MKLNKRKGFTVVELVIVIAIIAVLAAVLIPTFAGLVRKANISKDTQLVRNLNTALATATEKPKTMHEALQIAADAGYLVDKINASATSNEVLYDSKNNVFCYYNATNPSEGSVEYIPESAQGNQINDPEEYYLLWKIYDKNDDIPAAADQKFSVYLADDAKVLADGKLTVSVGFDAGNNASVAEVTYTGTKSAVIRTVNGKLIVDAPNAHVEHYGLAKVVEVKAVSPTTYVEHGTVAKMNVTATAGRIVVENGALVGTISGSNAGVTYEKKEGGLVLAAAEGASDALSKVVATADEKAAFVYEISTAAELAAFRDSVNAGMTYDGLTVKLTADIDLSTQGNWNPIGNRYALKNDGTPVDTTIDADKAFRKAFMGTFDGQGHTISGLFINTVDANYKGTRAKAGQQNTSSYAALFGYVDKATVKNFTVNGTVLGTDVAGVIGILGEGCLVDGIVSNVTVGGTAGENEEKLARGKAGGLINMTKGGSSTIKNCTNNGRVTSTKKDNGFGDYAGGIIALIQHDNITIENCKNTGDISTYAYYVGGIVGAASDNAKDKTAFAVKINNCTNTGNITLTDDKVNSKDDGVGAIIGACGANSAVTISNGCTNKGIISGKETYDTNKLVGKNSPTANGKDVTGVTPRTSN